MVSCYHAYKALDFYQQHFAESARRVEQVNADLAQVTADLQQQLKNLQDSQTHYTLQLSQIETLFAQKQQEEELHPFIAERRLQARNALRASGIEAYPFYMLIDFSEALSYESDMAGQIEYLLADAGLLDALIVSPMQASAALDILKQESLSDCIMAWTSEDNGFPQADQTEQVSVIQAPLLHWLRCDPTFSSEQGAGWQTLVSDLLVLLARTIATSSHNGTSESALPSSTWHYGLLSGHAGQGRANVIGRPTRRARHQQELSALAEQIELLRRTMYELVEKIRPMQEQIDELQECRDGLKKLLITSKLQEVMQQMPAQIATLKQTWSRYRQIHEHGEQKRQERLAQLAVIEKHCQGIPQLKHSSDIVKQAIASTHDILVDIRIVCSNYEQALTSYTHYQSSQQLLARKQRDLSEEHETLRDMQNQTQRARATVQQLEQRDQSEDLQDPETRRRHLQEQDRELDQQIGAARQERGKCEERVSQFRQKVIDAGEEVIRLETQLQEKRQVFQDDLKAYPLPPTTSSLWEQANLIAAARHLLADLPAEETLTIWKERLDKEYKEAQDSLNTLYYEQRATLYVYGPEKSVDNNQIIFLHEERSNPAELLHVLENRVQTQEVLLEQEERKLFEDFLLQHMAQEISEHIHRAQDWVQKLNTTLQTMIVVGDRYDLDWRPIAAPDLTRPGGHLALHVQLLRKKKQILTPEEREVLQQAFQQEIQTLRRLQKSDTGVHFEDLLREIFDYRAWFHFDIYITPQGGKRMLLDNKVLGGRSGAERLFALYIPLFAALFLLYDKAAVGAPRLLALDEAFDKASVTNMQRTIEFLVEQHFHWIMTGPQINLSGARIPVSIRYLMLHEKGSKLATVASSRT